MKKTLKISIIIVVVFVSTATIFGIGVAVGGSDLLFGPRVALAEGEPPQFSTFWQAWDIVHQHFVDRAALDPTKLTYGAIRGMINALGDQGHTVFLTPEELAREQTDISGKYTGIGAQLGIKDGLPMIVAPFDGSPAAKAGVKAGDIIMDIDGQDVTSWPLNEIVDHIRGEAGTTVVLTLLRPEQGNSFDVTITRGEIEAPTATWAMLPGTHVALIRLSQFSANATTEMVKAITEAKAAGATGLIVDVRNNPGGLLEQAISVTSQFLTNGNVLQEEDAAGNRKVFPVEAGGVAPKIPLVVLINRGTASSSEIFSGAIQDYQRGKLVGETTFGTGTVLEPFKLNDGSAIMLGTRQWLTAKGRLIRNHGIEPDVTVKLPITANVIIPADVKDLTVSKLLASEDTQVLKALELLNALPSAPNNTNATNTNNTNNTNN